MNYPTGYKSDSPANTIIEMKSRGSFSEHLPGCERIQCILAARAKVSPGTPHPLVIRKPVLRGGFEKELGDVPRNTCRDDRIPRFLLVDLDSFRSFLVDANDQAQSREERA